MDESGWEVVSGERPARLEDALEVAVGYECGLSLERFDDLRPADLLEIYEVVVEPPAAALAG